MIASTCAVLHVTDSHLFEDTHLTKNGINPYESLSAVLAEACAVKTPDVVIASGDIAHDPTPATYRVFRDLVRSYHNGPFLVAPGNHDRWAAMQSTFDRTCIDINDWRLMPLDTHREDRVSGQVSRENLLELKHHLEQADKHVIVVGHHPLLEVGVAWLDAHRVQNAAEVLSIFEVSPKVQAYLCGHVHLESARQHGQLKLWTTPSTCWQFAHDVDTFELSTLAPGWRWLELHTDGTIDTYIERLSPSCVSGIA